MDREQNVAFHDQYFDSSSTPWKENTNLRFTDSRCQGYVSSGFHRASFSSVTGGLYRWNDRSGNPNIQRIQCVKFTNCVELLQFFWFMIRRDIVVMIRRFGIHFYPIVKLNTCFYQAWGWDRKDISKRRTIPAILHRFIITKSHMTNFVVVKALDHISGAKPPHMSPWRKSQRKFWNFFFFFTIFYSLPFGQEFSRIIYQVLIITCTF
jgi:hypothetical protein